MRSILYIGNKLSRHGFTPGVIETLGPLLEKEGYRVHYAGTYKNQGARLFEIILKAVFIGQRVDYILIDTYSTNAFWYSYLTGLAARLTRTKYIPILHGGNLPLRLMKSKRACDSLFLNSYANVAVSGYLRHEFKKAGYRTVTIPNSVDISKYPFRLRKQPCPKLLWVRSFHRQYNPNMAADVLKELLKIYPEAELCMVGPDKDGSVGDFNNYVNILGISSHVKVTGLLKKKEWIKISEDYDFFINTTNVDNTPISVIEAMALGLAIISTDPGGIRYILQDGSNAMLVKTGDYITMAGIIADLIEDSSDARLLTYEARRNAEQFDWSCISQKWLTLLK